MTSEEKKELDELALKTGQSINRTVLDSVKKTNKDNELKQEISTLKEHVSLVANGVNALNENYMKQANAIAGLVELFRAKGIF